MGTAGRDGTFTTTNLGHCGCGASPGETALPSQMPHLSLGQKLPCGQCCRRNEFVTLNQGRRENSQTLATTPNLGSVPLSTPQPQTQLLLQAWPCVTAHQVPGLRGELRSRGRGCLVGFLLSRIQGKRGFSSSSLPPATRRPQGGFAIVPSHGLVG